MPPSLSSIGIRRIAVPAAMSLAGLACHGATAPDDLGSDLPGTNNVLLFEDSLGTLDPVRELIRTTAIAATGNVLGYLAVSDVLVRVQDRPDGVIPELGLGGRSLGPSQVEIFVDPGFADLEASIRHFLPYLLAHELHHTVRYRDPGYGVVLIDAIVSEGLADHFAIEVTGDPPAPWSTALADPELGAIAERARLDWYDAGYSHSAWFFGADPTIPRWAGYTLGFVIVGDYLTTHPDARASTLVSAPTATVLPE